MKISRRQFFGNAATTAAVAWGAPALLWTKPARASGEPVKVGSLLDLSGPLAASGQPMYDALLLAVSEINSKGGVLGRPVQVQNYDPQANIQLYSQYAQQIALKDRSAMAIGGITSASREAIRPVFDRFQIPFFSTVLYEGGVCDRNTFLTGTTPAQTVGKLVPYAMSRWGKKVYILAADYNYGQITAKWMAKYTREAGGTVLSTDFFPLDASNFSATISKIQAAKPDIVLSALVGSNHTAFYRQWASAGMKSKIPIASTTFGLVNETATLSEEESHGIVTSYGYYEELQTPASQTFVHDLHAKFGSQVPYISELASSTYEAMWLWALGVNKANSLDHAKVVEALESGLSFDGPTGKVMLDHATHHTTRNTFLAEAANKQWKVLQTFPNQPPADTALVCDLIKNPTISKQFVVDVSK